jgi:hypothetical protein
MAKQEKTFEEKTHHIIAETSNEKGGGTILKVMSWVVDGKEMKPCIEKRDYWNTEQGERRVGKAKGLTGFDFLTLLRKRYVIAQHLQIAKTDIDLAVETETVGAPPTTRPDGQAF